MGKGPHGIALNRCIDLSLNVAYRLFSQVPIPPRYLIWSPLQSGLRTQRTITFPQELSFSFLSDHSEIRERILFHSIRLSGIVLRQLHLEVSTLAFLGKTLGCEPVFRFRGGCCFYASSSSALVIRVIGFRPVSSASISIAL
jgi:hypothetical protein